MKQYLYSIVVISVVSALFRVLCPDRGSIGKFFSFLTSAVLLCATVTPLSGLIAGISDGVGLLELGSASELDYSAVWAEKLSGTTADECERAISKLICREFDISEGNIKTACTVSTENSEIRLQRIDVTLYSAALFKNPRRIESYLTELFSVPCCVSEGGLRQSE